MFQRSWGGGDQWSDYEAAVLVQGRTVSLQGGCGEEGENANSQGNRNSAPQSRVHIESLTWVVLPSLDENIIDLMRDYPKAYDFINEKITHTPGRLSCYINN